MFNKRDNSPAESGNNASQTSPRTGSELQPQRRIPEAGGGAVIGASIEIDGTLKGNEDLLIQGSVKGTVELKNNSVTIGETSQVTADIFAQTIAVEGQLEGKLFASERVMIRRTARIKGTIMAPRVMLEDGARFNGSIDMDPQSDALKAAFSPSAQSTSKGADQPAAASSPTIAKREPEPSGEATAKRLP